MYHAHYESTLKNTDGMTESPTLLVWIDFTELKTIYMLKAIAV